MKKPILVLLCILLAPVTASALQADDLVAIAAMPLAVAAVADIAEVPTSDLLTLIATMNNALVPAPQFIEVVRYAPVALVDTREPFVPYVTTQYDRGVTGQALAIAMEDRIETYDGADTIDVVSPPRVVAYDYDYLYPPVVVTRFQPVRFDPLALVAMPLAIAAVSEITDVPPLELASLAGLLNQARMPPAQFVEVVRYSPVALIDPDPQFLTFVTTEVGDGRRGLVLARAIEDRYHLLGVDDIDIIDPPAIRYVTETNAFLPPIVRTHIATARSHPHGGPPGQLKKELGLQTGAEVVHGTHPGRGGSVASRGSSGKARSTRVVDDRGSSRVTTRGKSGKSSGSGKAVTRGKSGGAKAVKAKRVSTAPQVDRGRPVREEKQITRGRGNSGGAVKAPKTTGGGKSSPGGQGGGGGKSNAGKKGKG